MLARVLHLAELTATHSLKHMLPIMHVNNEENKNDPNSKRILWHSYGSNLPQALGACPGTDNCMSMYEVSLLQPVQNINLQGSLKEKKRKKICLLLGTSQ